MGNIIRHFEEEDKDSAWQEQNKEIERNPMYKYADLSCQGKLITAYRKGGVVAVQEIARKEIQPYLKNGGKGAQLTRLGYVKWIRSKEAAKSGSTVWETKSDEELLQEWDEQEKRSLNKVVDHEVCWDPDKRGGVGETPLHLLYLTDSAEHTETAKILLNMYPKLALDIYEADEYFGESCLHLATVYGDFESVKLLVSNGAYINQRATGRFFLPEDQKTGQSNETNYQGYAYYGEYPLAFAVCFGYMDIYDYLIDNGADPNLQDSFGNTALHMAVISDQAEMYKYMVKHHKKPARREIRNHANLTPLTLASKLGRHKLFKEILEIHCITASTYTNNPYQDIVCSKMYCRIPDDLDHCELHRADDHTACGFKKWCINGTCIHNEHAPAVPDDCPWGDDNISPFSVDGKPYMCKDVTLPINNYLCYTDFVAKRCCDTCNSLKSNKTGCEYGDSSASCADYFPTNGSSPRPTMCYTNKNADICCASCAKYRTNASGCEYGDKDSSCTNYFPTDGSSPRPSMCYTAQNADICCASCAKYRTNIVGCEYGDKLTGCQRAQCDRYNGNNLKGCCETCKDHAATIVG